MTSDPTTVTKLDELMTAIRGYDDPRRAAGEWKQVYHLLQKTDVPSARVTHVVGMRDVVRLTELIDQLRAPAAAAGPPHADAPSEKTCNRALRAFRKRLTLTRLDEESQINSHNPLSKGTDSRVAAAITPPIEWPEAVWQELVRQGRLRCIGHGLYELTKQ
jgi:hypothetical protein